MSNLRDALSYVPVELGFGTSGLRGLAVDMTDLECYINTTGFIKFLEQNQHVSKSASIYLAGDLRLSTPRITKAVAMAIRDAGYKVQYGGLVPTPAIANVGIQNSSASIMVTGSHIPADRNGIKFNKVGGEILKPDEEAVKSAVAVERERIYSTELDQSPFDENGSLKDIAYELPEIISDVSDNYLRRYADVFSATSLSGKKVVVYQHSAVGRDMLVELLTRLGAEVTTVGRSDVFIPIDTENVTPDDQEYFKKIAGENPGVFAIVSTDGDSDRPFVIDENGTFHRGDELGAVVAKWLSADFAAIPVSSNDAVDQFLKAKNIDSVHTRIGSPYVIEAMANAESNGKKRIVGWEVNGGFLLGSDFKINGKVLTSLPTRDAFFPILSTLISASEQSISISDIFKQLPARFTQAGLIDDFPVETSKKILATFGDNSSQTRAQLNEYFTSDNGFDGIVSTNSLDGIRIYFKNGDIAHLRPSGNAPQMRIYSVAGTQERADEIVALGVQESGILSHLANRFSA